MTIYPLAEDYRELLDILEDEPDDEAVRQTLEMVGEDLIEKADGYGMIMKQMDSDIEGLKAEIKRLTAKKKAIENRKEWFRDAIKYAMLLIGEKKIKTPKFSFSTSTRQKAVITGDLDDIPDDLLKITVEPKLSEITEYIKKHEVDWAHFEETKILTIR